MQLRSLPWMVLAGVLLSALPLWGALYRSNSLGQALEPIDEKERHAYRYVLQLDRPGADSERRLLFELGNLILQVEERPKAGERGNRIVTEQSFGASGEPVLTTKKEFSQDLLRRIERIADDSVNLTLHTYADGRLVESKELVNGELALLTTYYRGSEGRLSGLRVIGTDRETFYSLHTSIDAVPVYTEETEGRFSKLAFYPGNLIVQDVWNDGNRLVETSVSRDEADRLVVLERTTEGEQRYIYGPDGVLLEMESQKVDGTRTKITYLHDAHGVLDQTTELIEGAQRRRIDRWYGNGLLQTQTEWLDDIPVRSIRYLPDGTSVVTLFERGRPYADVTYAPDGKRVLSLEYRMER